MNRIKVFLATFLVLALCGCAKKEAHLVNGHLRGLQCTTLAEIVALPEEEIDLATAILVIENEVSPTVDIEKYRMRVDEMAKEILKKAWNSKNPKKLIKAMNSHLHKKLNFKERIPSGSPTFKDFSLASVIDTGYGNCLTISILYLALGERMGLPLYGVSCPNNFFVRLQDTKVKINIETTTGKLQDDLYYMKEYKLSPRERYFLKNLTKKRVISCYLVDIANVLNSAGKNAEAMAVYKRALELDPKSAEASYGLACSYVKDHLYDKAIGLYKKSLELIPQFPDAYYNLGIAYLNKYRYEEAINAFNKTTELKKGVADPYANIAYIHMKKGRKDEAIAACQKALEINPGYAEAYNILGLTYLLDGDTDEGALNAFNKSIELKKEAADPYLGLSYLYLKKGRNDEAIAACQKALEINPNYAEAYNSLGFIYFNKNRYEEAIGAFNKAIEFKNGFAEPYLGLAYIYIKRGAKEETIASCKKALEFYPGLAEAHHILGLGYLLSGDNDEGAADAFNKAIEFKKDFVEPYVSLAYLHVRNNRKEEAAAACQKALEFESASSEVYFNGGVIYASMNLYNEAVRAYRKGISIYPDYAPLYLYLGEAYLLGKHHKLASMAYKKAVGVTSKEGLPDLAKYFISQATNFADKKLYDEAILASKFAIQCDPRSAWSHFSLADVYAKKGRYNKAGHECLKVIEIDPNFAKAHLYLALSYVMEDNIEKSFEEDDKAQAIDSSLPSIRQMIKEYLAKRYAKQIPNYYLDLSHWQRLYEKYDNRKREATTALQR